MLTDHSLKTRVIIIGAGGVPLLALSFLSHVVWADAAVLGYILTAVYFGLLLVPDYPPFGTKLFWKTMLPITGLHSAVVVACVQFDLNVPQINRTPQLVYAVATTVLLVEWRIALWFLSLFDKK